MTDNASPLNQTPEQRARDRIDQMLGTCGWAVQEKSQINWHVAQGIAVRHYPMQDGTEADYRTKKNNLDIFWLKDKSLADLDNLPDPDLLAGEIIENLEAGLASFQEILGVLGKS